MILGHQDISEGVGYLDLWRQLKKFEINIAAQAGFVRAKTAGVFYHFI